MDGKTCCAPSAGRGAAEGPAPAGKPLRRVSSGSTDGMALIPGGRFLMGTDDPVGFPDDGEGPIREIEVDPFHIDRHPVTNRQFEVFVRRTRYRTESERFGWSFVFRLFLPEQRRAALEDRGETVMGLEWWFKVDGAQWRYPYGPGSSIRKKADHPVVHISHADALAYAAWAGKRLPTEAEWECAARGGLTQKRYAWGDELTPGGRHMCNIWQGDFPRTNTAEDGYAGTSPVFAFPPNSHGLHDVAGNVWEWCHDWWSRDFHVTGPRVNPAGPPAGDRRVMRGGSHLCHDSYCNRYRVAARTSNTPDSSTTNLGFRCARDV